MRPKFEVGEVVLLRSKTYPQYNGEFTVVAVNSLGQVLMCQAGSGVRYTDNGTFSYSLGFSVEHHGGVIDMWAESALRKKHQPGDMSFDSLMASLSSPKLLTHQPEGVAPL